ncbi:MAG: TVP38/TMEM64 family protein, partial [Bacilli bacterium]
MTIETVKELLSYDTLHQMFEQYKGIGPFIAIGLPFLEAFLPFLPVVVFFLVNAASFGLIAGTFYSWVGTTIGSFVVFLIIRQLRNKRLGARIAKHPAVARALSWIAGNGFGFVFFMYAIPFTPSSVIGVVSGLSGISIMSYALALVLGKLILVIIFSYVGYDWHAILTEPYKLVVVGICILLAWLFGKRIEKRVDEKA